MLKITHFDSLQTRLENGPPLDALCNDCQKLNLTQLFSGPRYEDFDYSWEGPKELDVLVGNVDIMRLRASECRICHILIALHDALHTDDHNPWGPGDCDETIEKCVLKPYRTDIILHTPALSDNSNTNSIATCLALSIEPRRTAARYTKGRTIEMSEGTRDNHKADSHVSTSGVLEAVSSAAWLPKSAYLVCNFFLSPTSKSCIENRPVLSLSDSAYGSVIDWLSLRAWFTACEADHAMCRSTSPLFTERGDACIRCVDVQTSAIVPVGPETQYIALSYV